jgi:hypothetical protein
VKAKTTGPDPAQVGPRWVDKFGRVRTPRAYFEYDDGTVVQGHAAVDAMNRACSPAQAPSPSWCWTATLAIQRQGARSSAVPHVVARPGRATAAKTANPSRPLPGGFANAASGRISRTRPGKLAI